MAPPATISFAVQPTLATLAIDPYQVPRNFAIANNPGQPASNVYKCYGPVTVNYISHVYPPGTVQSQSISDGLKDTARPENLRSHKGNGGYDKLAADNAALALRLTKTERDLEELRAQLAVSVSHLLLAHFLLTMVGALNKTRAKVSDRSKSPVPATPTPKDACSKAGSRAASPARSNQGGGWGGNSNVGSAAASKHSDQKNQDQGWGGGGAGGDKGGAEDGWGSAPDAAEGAGGW